MPVYNEGRYKHDFLKYEVDPKWSREMVNIGGTANIAKGTVLGIKSADSKFWPSVQGAADGTQNAVAVLMEDYVYDATAAKQFGVAVVRGAIFLKKGLVWDVSYTTDPQKATAMAALRLLGLPCVDSGPVS